MTLKINNWLEAKSKETIWSSWIPRQWVYSIRKGEENMAAFYYRYNTSLGLSQLMSMTRVTCEAYKSLASVT